MFGVLQTRLVLTLASADLPLRGPQLRRNVRSRIRRMASQTLDPTVSLLFEVTKIMIPVLTGLVALLGASFGKLWETSRSDSNLNPSWSLAACAVAAAVVSLAFFCGVMALCIKASTGIPQDFFAWSLPPDKAIDLAGDYMAWEYTSLMAAIALAAAFYFRIWSLGPPLRSGRLPKTSGFQ